MTLPAEDVGRHEGERAHNGELGFEIVKRFDEGARDKQADAKYSQHRKQHAAPSALCLEQCIGRHRDRKEHQHFMHPFGFGNDAHERQA